MSASFPRKARSDPRSLLQRAQPLLRLLEEGRAKTALSRDAFFLQALLVWDATLRQADMDEFLNVACVGVEKAMRELAAAFALLLTEAMNQCDDLLGTLYMLAQVRSNPGEEYTPWELVRLVVRLTFRGFTPPAPGDPPITIYDGCCGSGAFLLGVLDYLETFFPEVLNRGQVHLYGQEATRAGWLMCRINLRLHAIGIGYRLRQPSARLETTVMPQEEPPERHTGERDVR